jgi:hypothetical protein
MMQAIANRAFRPALAAAILLAALGPSATADDAIRRGAVPVGVGDLPPGPEPTGTAEDLGLNFLHTKIRWDEPTEGDYVWTDFADDDPLMRRLAGLKEAGYTVAVTVENVKDDRINMPRYLKGRPLNDPAVLSRWGAYLAAFLGRYGEQVDFVNLGYKVNAYFDKHEKEWPAFVRFVRAGAQAVRRARPRTSVGVVLTDDDDPARYWKDLAPACTHLGFVYTMPASIIEPDPPAAALDPRQGTFFGRTLQAAVRMAGGRKVLLLDVACPTHPSIDASPALQARFIRSLFGWLRRAESRIAGLTWTGDKDWPYEATKNALAKMFGDRILQYRGFVRYLTSVGLRDEGGEKKPGYAAFKEALEAYRKGR